MRCTVLLAAVAMAGALSLVLYQTISGPMSSMVRVTNKTAAKAQLQSVASIIIMDAINNLPNSGDCDADGNVEPRSWRPGTGPAGSFPAGGGLVPTTIGAPTTDPWGTDYGYCVWDVGSSVKAAGCDTVNGYDGGIGPGYNALRKSGSPTPTAGKAITQTVIAVISAGPDRHFQTSCHDYVDANTDLITAAGDDVMLRYTYTEAASATASLWTLKASDSTKAIIGKNLEVGSNIGTVPTDVSTAFGSNGIINAAAVVTKGAVISGGAVRLANDTAVTSCVAANAGDMRFNATSKTIEVCDGAGNWNGSSSALSGLTIAKGPNTIDNTLYPQEWDWSTLTTQTALKLTASALTTGTVLEIDNTNAAGTGPALKVNGKIGMVPGTGFAQPSAFATGTMSISNGGTGTTSAFTQGSVVFAGASGVYSQDNANFFWDATDHRLGIGTTGPDSLLSLSNGNLHIGNTSTTSQSNLIFDRGALASISATQGTLGFIWDGGLAGNNEAFVFNVPTGDDYRFKANASDLMVIKNNGNVGIGTTNPLSRLQLFGSNGQLTANLTDAGDRRASLALDSASAAAGSGFAITFGNGQSETAGTIGWAAIKALLADGSGNTMGDLAFSTRNSTSDTALTERMRISSSGNVGIGTIPSAWGASYPGNVLQVGGAGFEGPPGYNILSQNAYYDGSNWKYIGAGTAQLAWFNNGVWNWQGAAPGTAGNTAAFSTLMTLNSSGLGIGTTGPAAKLDVQTTSATAWAASFFSSATAGGNNVVHIDTSSTNSSDAPLYVTGNSGVNPLMIVRANGNVGIGTTSPVAKLTVSDASNAYQEIWADNDNNGAAQAGIAFGYSGSATNPTRSWDVGTTNAGLFTIATRSAAWAAPNDTPALAIDTSGNVGIGTTSPGATLQVGSTSGSVYYTLLNGLRISGVDASNNIWQPSGPLSIDTNGSNLNLGYGNGLYALTIQGSNGYVGIGTTSPGNTLEVNGGVTIDGGLQIGNVSSGSGGETIFGSGNLALWPQTAGPNATVAFWGFYPPSPGSPSNLGQIVGVNGGTNIGSLAFSTANSSGPVEHMRIAPNGYVGVGVYEYAPRATFDVYGGTLIVTGTDINGTAEMTSSGGNAYFSNNTIGNGITIAPSGAVSIGEGPTGYMLDVNGDIVSRGNIYCAACGNWLTAWLSDRRLKKNIQPLGGDNLALIEKLQAVTWNWKKPEERTIGKKLILNDINRRQMGLIAQDVEKVFPMAIWTGDNGIKRFVEGGLTAPIVEAIKELDHKFEALAVKVAGIIARLNPLEAEVRDLKSLFNGDHEVIASQAAEIKQLKAANDNLEAEIEDLRSQVGKRR